MFFFLQVFQHHYGQFGAERRKMDSHSLAIDFEIFQQMAENSFADSLQKAIDNFANQLIEKRQLGMKN